MSSSSDYRVLNNVDQNSYQNPFKGKDFQKEIDRSTSTVGKENFSQYHNNFMAEVDLFPSLKYKHPRDAKKGVPDLKQTLQKLYQEIPLDGKESVDKGPRSRVGTLSSMKEAVSVGDTTLYTACAKGPKSANEDRFDYGEIDLGTGKKIPFYGVYDGHGGDKASEFLKKNMRKIVGSMLSDIDINNPVQIKQAFKAAFIEAHAQFESSQNGIVRDGATCIVALEINGRLWVANAGDGRAVLAKDKQAVQLSRDAVATESPFRQSLEKRGDTAGYLYQTKDDVDRFGERGARWHISQDNPMEDKNIKVHRTAISRVFERVPNQRLNHPFLYRDKNNVLRLPTLMPARVIGDIRAKSVSPRPKVKCYDLSQLDSKKDNYLIMASDGLWDVIHSQEAVDLIQKATSEKQNDGEKVQSIANNLLESAYQNGDWDNTTITVVKI